MKRIVTSRTGRLWGAVEEQLKKSYHSGKKVLLLVPEQITLQVERDAMKSLGVKGFFRLQVLSPSRLMKVVFDRARQDERVVIDERGQNMTLSRAMWNLKDELLYYGRARTKPGFTQKLGETISEIKSAGVSPVELAEYAQTKEGGDPKLLDLALLYAAYEEAMSGQLMDSEDRETQMLTRLASLQVFSGYDILVYGFDLLTPPLIRQIALLIAQADQFLLTLQTENRGAVDGPAFDPVNDSILQLKEYLAASGHTLQQETLKEEEGMRPKALLHLERRMLRIHQEPYMGEPHGLHLYAAKTAHEEIRRAAQSIYTHIKNGQDPRRIAVYLAQDSYAPLIDDVFSAYGIESFVSIKEPLTAQPLIRCLLDAMKCIQAAVWRPYDVFNYIKSPYSPLSEIEAFELENYAREFGIRGRKWTQPFSKGEEARLLQMEELRERAITPVDKMRAGISRARDAAASIQAVLDFLADIKAQDKVLKMDSELTALGLLEEAQRSTQVWDKLMGFFEQMNQLLGQERVPLGRFAEWLEAGLSITHLSALPPKQQSVQAGLLGQLMIREPDLVYVLGLNSGVLNVNEDSLIRDKERLALESGMKVRLNLQVESRESIRQMDLWKAISGASHQVYLSYALSDEQGKPLTPLMELTRILKMFPLLMEEGGALNHLREPLAFTPMVALDEIAVLLSKGEMTSPWWEAYEWLSASKDWEPYLSGIKTALTQDDPEKTLGEDIAQKLMKMDTSSVSRLETYAACPFRHFVQYGLIPGERKEWALKNTDLGIFCHAALDAFTREAMRSPDWPQVNREQSEQMMDQALEELTIGWEEAPWADTHRARRNAEVTKDLCRRMAWALTEGGAASAYHTVASELNFGPKGALPAIDILLDNGDTLSLRGTIDRVDALVMDSSLQFIRVVDYKSGATKAQAGELEVGAQLQLMLYLYAALRNVKGAVPAGAFYQQMKNPLVSAADENEAIKKSRVELRLNGVLLNDSDAVRLMDEGKPPITLPEYQKANGEVKEGGNLLTREELDSLMDLALRRTRELAGSIFKGQITRSPLIKANGQAVCAYCEYKGICRTEKISKETKRRRARSLTLKALAQEQIAQQKGASSEG